MLSKQTHPMQSGNSCYSEGFDCLLALATSRFRIQATVQSEEMLLEQWHSLCQTKNLEQELEQGLEGFRKELCLALEYLRGPETVRGSQDADLAHLHRAFSILDTMLYLQILVEEAEEELLSSIPINFQEAFQLMSLEALVDTPLLNHRFIPMNKWRRAKLASLPTEEQDRFPWYEEWGTLPESTLGELIAHWREIVEKGEFAWLDMEPTFIRALITAIRADTACYQSLRTRAGVSRQVKESVSSAVPSVLMALSKVLMDPEQQQQPDRERTQVEACRSIIQPLASEQERYERLFLVALFEQALPAMERLSLFKEIGSWLEGQPKVSQQSLAWRLLRWVEDRTTGPDLVAYGRKTWRLLLGQGGRRAEAEADFQPMDLSLALHKLLKMPVVDFTTPVDQLIERLRGMVPAVRLVPDRTMLESLFATLFPGKLALGSAASGSAVCQYLRLGENTPPEHDYLQVELSPPVFATGVRTYSGRIDFDPAWPFPNQQFCGFVTSQGEVYCAQTFTLDPLTCTFHSDFVIERDITGQLRILLIHEGE